MALANLGRNKKRTITVICSLTLGLVLLSCVYAKNASFDINKYMSQTVISDFEVEDSSISSTFGTYNPYGTTISPVSYTHLEKHFDIFMIRFFISTDSLPDFAMATVCACIFL